MCTGILGCMQQIMIDASQDRTVTFNMRVFSSAPSSDIAMTINFAPVFVDCTSNIITNSDPTGISLVLNKKDSTGQLTRVLNFANENVNVRFTTSINGCPVVQYKIFEVVGSVTQGTEYGASDVTILNAGTPASATITIDKTNALNKQFKIKAIGHVGSIFAWQDLSIIVCGSDAETISAKTFPSAWTPGTHLMEVISTPTASDKTISLAQLKEWFTIANTDTVSQACNSAGIWNVEVGSVIP